MTEPIFELPINDAKDDRKYILKYIDMAHQILYESENIEGEGALNDIMHFIFIRLLEGKLSKDEEDGKIDLLNKKYYQNIGFEDKNLDEYFKYFDLENVSNEELTTIRSKDNLDVIKILGKLFHYHPVMKQIYDEFNFINAEKPGTIQNLLNDCILKIDMEKFYNQPDAIGIIYEHFISGYTKLGSKLGQYFTPRKMMNLVLGFIKPDITKKIKKIEEFKVADLCSGTAGWLVLFYNMFKEKYADKIQLICGEVKASTFQIGLMNIISTINKMPYKAIRENCLTHIDDEQYDLILTNPPFRTDFKFKNIDDNFKNDQYNEIDIGEIFKLKSNKPIVQFLELYIYKLKEKGTCLIVLPFGELFFGKMMKKVRKYLIKNIDIKYIIEFESGIFTHTGIKTCVMIFNKSKGTKEITFLKADKECTKLFEIVKVSEFDENYSLYYRNYIEEEIKVSDEFESIKFGKVFELEKGKIQSSKVEEDKDGIVFVTGANENNWKTIKLNDKYILIDGENTFISENGNGDKRPIKYYKGTCYYSNLMSRLVVKDEFKNKINIKFYYYYLKHIQKFIEEHYQVGSCNKKLDIDNFNKMNIPLPSIEEQNKIVKQLDVLNDGIDNSNKLIKNYEESINIYVNTEIDNIIEKTKIIKLKDLCNIKYGSSKIPTKKEGMEKEKYPLYAGGEKSKRNSSEFNVDKNTILIARSGSSGSVNITTEKSFVANYCFIVENIDKKYETNYLYYKLKSIENKIKKMAVGSTQPNLNIDDLKNIDIETVSKEFQTNIIKKCDKIKELIKSINEQSEFNKKIIIEIINVFNLTE